MSDDDTIPNPYLAAIKAARASSVDPCHTLRTAFTKASTAMSAGAWVGGKADTFGSSLHRWSSTSSSAATAALDEFDEAIAREGKTPMVSPNSWQVHWHNI